MTTILITNKATGETRYISTSVDITDTLFQTIIDVFDGCDEGYATGIVDDIRPSEIPIRKRARERSPPPAPKKKIRTADERQRLRDALRGDGWVVIEHNPLQRQNAAVGQELLDRIDPRQDL